MSVQQACSVASDSQSWSFSHSTTDLALHVNYQLVLSSANPNPTEHDTAHHVPTPLHVVWHAYNCHYSLQPIYRYYKLQLNS